MTKRFRAIAGCGLPALVLLAAGCKPFSGPLPGDPTPAPYFIQHLSGEGAFPLDIDLGDETRDVYLTFVNPDLGTSSGVITVSGSAASEAPDAGAPVGRDASVGASVTRRAPTPEVITEFNQNPFGARGRPSPSLRLFERPPGPPLRDEADVTTATFYDFRPPYTFISVPSTCRGVVTKDVPGGIPRTLNIWVENDCWAATPDPGNPKTFSVTPGMVTAIEEQFLQAGSFNDIYDWVTGMLGPEWGAHQYTDLIDPNDEITIWLCDIEDDDVPAGSFVVGYFWSKDNFVKAPGVDYYEYSHERVMFTIDAVMYANDSDAIPGDPPGWHATDYWPEEIHSTLAHEFQHMIHFYQRAVLRDAMVGGDTWINEMASQVVEDLLADKMDVIGPRGVTGTDGTGGAPNNVEGRLPLFNYLNDISLEDWGGSGDLPSYSITYAFGAWLARNYGGAMLLNRLMQTTSTGRASIEDIVSQATGKAEYFPRLLQRWSAAQLLSNVTDAPPGYRYNVGAFFDSTVGAASYKLGSINLFNYRYGTLTGPWIYTGAFAGTSPYLSASATLYRAAAAETGPLEFTLDMPEGLIVSVIVR